MLWYIKVGPVGEFEPLTPSVQGAIAEIPSRESLQTLISNSSVGWEVQDRGTERFRVCWKPAAGFIDERLLTVSSHSRNERYQVLLSKGTTSIHAGSTLTAQSPPKGPPPDTITLGAKISMCDFGGCTLSPPQPLMFLSQGDLSFLFSFAKVLSENLTPHFRQESPVPMTLCYE